MTVGFFIDEYLPRLHGDITSTIALRNALEAHGHTVYIVAPAEPGYVDDDSQVIRVPSFDPRLPRYKTRVALLYPGLAKKLAKYKFDVVHSQTQFGVGVLAHATAKALGVPHVSTLHSVFAETAMHNRLDAYAVLPIVSIVYPLYFRSMPKYNWTRPKGAKDWARVKEQAWWACGIFLNSTDDIIVPSAHLAKTLRKHGVVQNCHILPNGLDVKSFQKVATKALPKDVPTKGKDIWFTYVGRLAAEKRPQVLIDAMKLITNKRIKLLVVGEGPDEQSLVKLVAKYGLQNQVYMLGRREPRTVPLILASSDAFVLASYRFDNQPMVILEALAACLPVIYCDDQLTEGLTKKNALLTPTVEPESFAKAMTTLAGDAKKRKAMAAASAALADKFDIMQHAKKVEEIYTKAIDRKKSKT